MYSGLRKGELEHSSDHKPFRNYPHLKTPNLGNTQENNSKLPGTELELRRRQWQPTPVFLPGESQEQRSLEGCRLWGHTDSDTTEATQQQQMLKQKLTLPRVKQIANGKLLHGSGNSNRGSVSIQRGAMGQDVGRRFKREEICVYLWLIHFEV